MKKLLGILCDLDRCVGCYSCEVACKQENNVPSGKKRIQVFSIGPEKVNGKLRMDFFPILLKGCTFCAHRLKINLIPRCVDNCPMEALTFSESPAEILAALNSGRRFQICKLKGKVSAFG